MGIKTCLPLLLLNPGETSPHFERRVEGEWPFYLPNLSLTLASDRLVDIVEAESWPWEFFHDFFRLLFWWGKGEETPTSSRPSARGKIQRGTRSRKREEFDHEKRENAEWNYVSSTSVFLNRTVTTILDRNLSEPTFSVSMVSWVSDPPANPNY